MTTNRWRGPQQQLDGITFRIDLANGHMLYDLVRDEWDVWAHGVGQCGDIGANKFRTIHEFKILATQMIANAQPQRNGA